MRGTRAGASPVMVGRDTELSRLRSLAASRRPHVALIGGEPGIGKTRLVQELLSSLPGEPVVLVGHAEPSSLARPYEVLLDAVSDRPDIDDLLTDLVDEKRSTVERLHVALTIVDHVADDRPAVILFEDMHWVDSESAALFERLADQATPRLLIGTYRPDEVTSRHPIATVLARLERDHAVTHIRLGRLTEADTAALLSSFTGAPVPYRVAAALHQRTGGNPSFLEELVRGYEGTSLQELTTNPMPWNLAEALRRQVDDLDQESSQVMEAAAVLGYRVSFDLLTAVTGVDEDTLIGILRDLVDRRVLVEAGDDEFTFRHALVREAITDHMLGRQRRRIHEAALDALLASEGSASLIAHHARAAGRYDDMVAASRRGAALYLSIGSPYEALQLAEMGLGEAPDDVDLLAAAARAAWLAELIDDALEHARKWLAHTSTAVERADALNLLIRLAWENESIDEMAAFSRQVEELVAELPPGLDQATAMAAVAQSAALRDDVPAVKEWADRAIALADELDLPEVRLAAQLDKCMVLIDEWPTNVEGEVLLGEIVDEAEKLGEWLVAARALNVLVQNAPPSSVTEHAELLERMRHAAERAGAEQIAVAAYYQAAARLALREGDLRTAVATIEKGRDHYRRYRRRGRKVDYHAVLLAGVYLEAGNLDGVAGIVDDLRALSGASSIGIEGVAFNLACRRGHLAAAEHGVDEVLAAAAKHSWRNSSEAHDLISAALHVGLPYEQLTRMREGLLDPRVSDDYRTLVDAQLAETTGDAETALTGYRSVVESQLLTPAVRGTAHVGAARCLIDLGSGDQAAEHVEAAEALLKRWGGWRVAQLAQLRDQLGLAAPESGGGLTGVAALTNREREVAVLVADGLTNAELARRLYISPKTAAVHVSSILRKLELSSRTEIRDALP